MRSRSEGGEAKAQTAVVKAVLAVRAVMTARAEAMLHPTRSPANPGSRAQLLAWLQAQLPAQPRAQLMA